MFSRFRIARRNRKIVDDLYDSIVTRSRRPDLFAAFGIPDTVMGRFESLALHVFLVLARCQDEPGLKPVAQDLVDRFVSDIEDSIREIGIGDVAVPKRMRKLTGMFYERVAAYDPPLRSGDRPALAAALRRFALAESAARDADGLSDYMVATMAALEAMPADRLLAGRLFDEEGQ